jgi:hypothetical protein
VSKHVTIPTCKIIVGKMLGQDAVQESEHVPLSNSTINRCTDDMLHDAEEVLFAEPKITAPLSRLLSQ